MKLKYLLDGIERVFKIIDSNENYNIILKKTLIKNNYEDIELMDSMDRKQYIYKYLDKYFKKYIIRKYIITDKCEILFYGETLNNKKELKFLQDKANFYTKGIEISNIGNFKITKTTSLKKDDIEYILKVLNPILNDDRIKTKSHLRQLILFVTSFLNFYFSLSEIKNNIFYMIVANDHSPIPVAFSMVAKELGIERVYLQHAEVSKSFPELDFEYNILRNQLSLDTYAKIGIKAKKKPIVISRYKKDFDIKNLQENLNKIKNSNKIDIVIYPTGTYKQDTIKLLVQMLKKNIAIGNIIIKLHPNGHKVGLENIGVELSQHDVLKHHIAIVGNSSVVIELLHKGIPVVQNFEIDSISEDYYGFVSSKIVKKINISEVYRNFWLNIKYDKEWICNYSYYNPSALKFKKQFNIAQLNRILYDLNGSYSREDYLYDLYLRISPITFLNGIGTFSDLNEFNLIKKFEFMFNQRDPYFNEILEKVDLIKTFSLSLIWLILKKNDWTGYEISSQTENLIIKFLYNYNSQNKLNLKTHCKLIDNLLNYFIRMKKIDKIKTLWSIKTCLKKNNLHINKRIALKKLIEEFHDENLISREDLHHNLSQFHRFKLEIATMNEFEFEINKFSHNMIKDRFVSLAPKSVSEEFKELDSLFYQKLNKSPQYLDIKWNKNQKEDLLIQIINKIKNKVPFSFIRLSDGEGYNFNNKNIFSKNDRSNRERHWWGIEIEDEVANSIKEKNLIAIKNADLIGVPTVYRFIRDHTDKSTSLSQSLTGRGLLEVIWGLIDSDMNHMYTDDKANLALFTNKKDLLNLASFADKVIFIGSASPKIIKNIFKDIKIHIISTKTHYKTTNNVKYVDNKKPLPYEFDNILNEIDYCVNKGDLVIVAAGVVGKMFIGKAKLKGAVALDIGSALDQLVGAGIHSLH